jgi:nucleoside-diphosphate kinase
LEVNFLYEETLVVLKPDTIERNLIGRIIKRYEDAGLKINDIKYYQKATESLIEKHYPPSMALSIGRKAQKVVKGIDDPKAQGKKVLERLRKYFTRGPVVAIKICGEDAIQEVRDITGYTDPTTAKKGTIRGDLGIDSLAKSTDEGRACENLVHASGNMEEAMTELELWFPSSK